MLRTVLLACLALAVAAPAGSGAVGVAGDELPRLVPGQRLQAVEAVTLAIAEAGTYTLGRSDGEFLLAAQGSEEGWLIVELAPGEHAVRLQDGPGDITALPGAIEPLSAERLLNRGIAQIQAAEFAAGRRSLLACRARAGSATDHAVARMFEGSLLQREGRLAEARELLLGSREAMEAAGRKDLQAFAEESLGQVALGLQDWEAAQLCFENLYQLAGGDGSRALALSRLAGVAAGRGDFDGARSAHEEALATLTEDCEPTYISSVTFGAGSFFKDRAEFARAAELLERAAASAPRWNQKVPALGQLAVVDLLAGRYGAAVRRMDEVEALAAAHAPSPFDDTVLRNRAALAFSLGDFAAARERLELLLTREPLEEARTAITVDLALLSQLEDDEAGAARLYDEALAATPAPTRTRWHALNGKSALLLVREQTAAAEPVAREALALARRLGDPYLEVASLLAVSESQCRTGALEAARADADAAVASVEARGGRDLLLPAWHCQARAALLQGDESTVERLLDRAWTECLREEFTALPSLESAQILSRVAELSDWGAVAADLAARRAAQGPAALAAGLRRAEQWKARTLLADLQGSAEVPEDLAAALRPLLDGRALVEYVAGHERLYAFVLEGDSLRFADLGARRPIEARLEAYLDGISDAGRLAEPADVARIGGDLYARLLLPLGLERDRLVIVPCGDLSRLPFEALVVSAAKEVRGFEDVVFVLDRMDVSYAPSSATLIALAARPAAGSGRGVLLLGDPTYAAEAAPDLLLTRSAVPRWKRLPHTREELGRMARLLLALREDEAAKDDLYALARLEGTRDVSLSTPSFELRLGRPASVEALRSLAPRARLIHVAAHADVDRRDPRRTGLVLAWEEAGHGIFGLADIAGLQLDADLVVLSACRTADGRLLNGEGVQSMGAAFLGAGARGVVATLWPVFDAQAQDLMAAFAEAWLVRGEAADQALTVARRALRASTPARGVPLQRERPGALHAGHPHDWASFVFTGAALPGARVER